MRILLATGAAAVPAIIAATALAGGGPGSDAGERAYQKCYSCHSLEPGRNELEGPTLHAVIGRRVAGEAGYGYSPALRRFAREHPVWTKALLDRFIADPETLVPGTSMSFTGIRDPAERAALMAHLKRAAASGP